MQSKYDVNNAGFRSLKKYIGFSNVLWGQNVLDITDTQCNIICSFAFYEDHICGALNIHSQLQCIHNAS